MYSQSFRMSRVSHPRASWWAMLLLVAVFLSFGVSAQLWLTDTSGQGAYPTESANEQIAIAQIERE